MNTATLRPVDELMWTWPSIIERAPDGWTRDFARSIARQAKRRGWKPSAKQHALMNKLVAEYYRRRGRVTDGDGPDFDLIERG